MFATPSHPYAFAAVAFAAVLALAAPQPLAARIVALPAQALLGSEAPSNLCPDGTLPDGDVCVRLLPEVRGEEAPVVANAHRVRSGELTSYEQIPRRPERPADYDAYRYPLEAGLPGGHFVLSGYDLDRPDPLQRRGFTLRATGHGGVDLPQRRGEPCRTMTLEGQRGDAVVVYAGPLFGTTVVTRHTLSEGGRLRDYLLLYGHLDRIAPGIAAARSVADGETLGFVGDTGSPELVHLHLEARRVREGIDVSKLEGSRLLASDVSIVCDPRNVLPLRE